MLTNSVTLKKRSAGDAGLAIHDGKSGGGGGEASYSYGLFNVPSNCRILKVDIDGQKDFANVKMDDVIMISNCIETAAKYITQSQNISKECGIIIKSERESAGDVTLVEYKVLMQFHIDTVIEIQHMAYIQHLNPLRCSGSDAIKVFCDSNNQKMCLLVTLSSTLNPIRPVESIIIHQHFKTLLYTTDQDDSSSTNPLDEVSINRKRARKGDIMYNKIHDTK